MTAEQNAETGTVTIQAMAISLITPHRTLPNLSEEPTPTMAELTTCVVLTGAPVSEAKTMTMAEVNCAAKL